MHYFITMFVAKTGGETESNTQSCQRIAAGLLGISNLLVYYFPISKGSLYKDT